MKGKNALAKLAFMFLAANAALAGTLSNADSTRPAPGAGLAAQFQNPPASARPWVYWFWLNGNITRAGIKADLEAMRRVGIGGVLIMEVDQGAPAGPVAFMSRRWRDLFQYAVAEAKRLGLRVNMNDDAGWDGSGGPWIKPAQAMQKVVWSQTNVDGPSHFDGALPQPPTVAGYYRDIAVEAFPAPGPYRIANIEVKADFQVGFPEPPATTNVPASMEIPRGQIRDLTGRMDSDGRLVWDAPSGHWTVLRFGYTCTGVDNHPAPASGLGLECDKLSPAGIEANFNGMMAKLASDVGSATGHTLVRTHIDSWENGAQNWTARMAQEFRKRRGYDLLPFLPVMTGRVVDSLPVSERFLWDLRQTISELVVENYAGRMAELAHEHGLRLSIEAYGGPCDDLPYAGQADEPMCEFWTGGGMFQTVKEMASAAHVYGKPVLGAESFTSDSRERWLDYPATIKALGDEAFCGGVQRFVFHRYALQPWKREYRPGMTMGPWGLHYERTETWWNWTPAWHRYLARCQYLLRQGRFVADLCYLRPEAAPQGAHPQHPKGYDYDECSADVVLRDMTVKDGRLVLPDGMSYRLLVLSEERAMTPPLLRKITQLVQAGATVVGPRPLRSPSLSDYPECDEVVKQLGRALWGDCDGESVFEHRFGQGRVVWGIPVEKILAAAGVPPDFTSQPPLNYIHRRADGADIYFVANGEPYTVSARCRFRVGGEQPEFWWPATGRTESAAAWKTGGMVTTLPLRLGPSGSVFVLFREPAGHYDPIVTVTRDGKSIWPAASQAPQITIEKAAYGVLSDPKRTRDVRPKVQHLVDAGEYRFRVAQMARGDDPAYGIVKTLVVRYTVAGRQLTATGTDPETMDLAQSPAPHGLYGPQLHRTPDGRLYLETGQPGRYVFKTASGKTHQIDVPALPSPLKIYGPWKVRFAPHEGAPARVTFDHLISWSQSTNSGVKYFSGTAAYSRTFNVPRDLIGRQRRLYLDLGRVEVMARVELNGHDLGVLWKPPYRVDITRAIRAGRNRLLVEVVNLWPNRMIGDEQLPEDSERNANGTLKQWPQWVLKNRPSPTGRYTFTTWRLWKKDSRLLPSGLLGPVTVKAVARVVVQDNPARD